MATRETPATDGRRSAAAARRRAREKEILAATRALFDERGVADAQIEDIARAVGINRAIVYRHFTGKEELFALTLVGYLDELAAALAEAAAADADAPDRLARDRRRFVDYGLAHPAFVDCAHALMRRTGPELLDEISEGALFRLGRGISSCLATLAAPSRPGVGAAATSRSPTPRCSPTRSTPAASARCSSPGSGSSSRRPPPAYPRSAPSRPVRSRTTSSPQRWRSRAALPEAADPAVRAVRPVPVRRRSVCCHSGVTHLGVMRVGRDADLGRGTAPQRRGIRLRGLAPGVPFPAAPPGDTPLMRSLRHALTTPALTTPALAASALALATLLGAGAAVASTHHGHHHAGHHHSGHHAAHRVAQHTASRAAEWTARTPDRTRPVAVQAPFNVASFNTLGNSHTSKHGDKPSFADGATRMRWDTGFILAHHLDLVGFQELQHPQARAFEQDMGDRYQLFSGSGDTENSIAWNAQRFTLVAGTTQPVPYFSGNIRHMPVVLLRDDTTGQKFYAMNVHNPADTRTHHGNEVWRERATDREVALVEELRTHGLPVIVTGDMNEHREGFCDFTRSGDLDAAAGGSHQGGCHAPSFDGIDWIFGTQGVHFSDFQMDHSSVEHHASDHGVPVARVS